MTAMGALPVGGMETMASAGCGESHPPGPVWLDHASDYMNHTSERRYAFFAHRVDTAADACAERSSALSAIRAFVAFSAFLAELAFFLRLVRRPRATAAGFLRAMRVPLGDVLRRERRDALQGQRGDLGRQGLERGDVASGEGGLTLVHEVAAGLSCGVHAQILHNDRTYVNRENTQ